MKQIYVLKENKRYRIELIEIPSSNHLLVVQSWINILPKDMEIIIDQENINEYHPDMVSVIILSKTMNLKISTISKDDIVPKLNFFYNN